MRLHPHTPNLVPSQSPRRGGTGGRLRFSSRDGLGEPKTPSETCSCPANLAVPSSSVHCLFDSTELLLPPRAPWMDGSRPSSHCVAGVLGDVAEEVRWLDEKKDSRCWSVEERLGQKNGTRQGVSLWG
ncbi:hypothetical protein BDK51DRAFT_41899 [Blyttiomyces helicus]|uniref:Uncharacterized protein n=1 Tax=Blyttiomyces helicus TaxID=388810 RepID=A0A4P9VWQ1_9FUNG|nr:hypothetical protein BDK51DRAFT_41899 [Blyttiomyces helicus]|eukprot:RKO83113.1 hypothetical protein BDK51DRAFT_41899 [Blyttiomyces helicus]